MIIRRAREEDVDPVIAFWREARYLPPHVTHGHDEDRSHFLSLQDVWVAERDGGPVGFMALSPGWIEQLHVAVPAQRSGVGRALVEHAKSLMDDIRLHTFQANAPARAFYARHGFQEIAFGVSDPPESEPDVLLRWRAEPAAPE